MLWMLKWPEKQSCISQLSWWERAYLSPRKDKRTAWVGISSSLAGSNNPLENNIKDWGLNWETSLTVFLLSTSTSMCEKIELFKIHGPQRTWHFSKGFSRPFEPLTVEMKRTALTQNWVSMPNPAGIKTVIYIIVFRRNKILTSIFIRLVKPVVWCRWSCHYFGSRSLNISVLFLTM